MKKLLIAAIIVLIASASIAVAKPEHKGHGHHGHHGNVDKHIEFVVNRFDVDKNGELSKVEIRKMFEARAEFIKRIQEYKERRAKEWAKSKCKGKKKPETKKECPKKTKKECPKKKK